MKTDFARRSVLALLLATLCLATPAQAHHSVAAEFDQSKPVTFTGTVHKVMWMNPHIYTHVAVKDATGETLIYRIEGGPPNALFRQGWRKDSLKVGDVVTISGSRAKNPESMNVGQATITAADGHKVFTGAGPATAASAPAAISTRYHPDP
jgi:cell shape-determining protein MreC